MAAAGKKRTLCKRWPTRRERFVWRRARARAREHNRRLGSKLRESMSKNDFDLMPKRIKKTLLLVSVFVYTPNINKQVQNLPPLTNASDRRRDIRHCRLDRAGRRHRSSTKGERRPSNTRDAYHRKRWPKSSEHAEYLPRT